MRFTELKQIDFIGPQHRQLSELQKGKMPGQLRPDATCPRCEMPLLAIADLTTIDQITREYFHDRDPEASRKARRKRRCKFTFSDIDQAIAERRALEIRP